MSQGRRPQGHLGLLETVRRKAHELEPLRIVPAISVPASLIPAIRAARVEPMQALREE